MLLSSLVTKNFFKKGKNSYVGGRARVTAPSPASKDIALTRQEESQMIEVSELEIAISVNFEVELCGEREEILNYQIEDFRRTRFHNDGGKEAIRSVA